jgi:hypothetical protein
MFLDFADLAAIGNSSRKVRIILDEDLCVLLEKPLYNQPRNRPRIGINANRYCDRELWDLEKAS